MLIPWYCCIRPRRPYDMSQPDDILHRAMLRLKRKEHICLLPKHTHTITYLSKNKMGRRLVEDRRGKSMLRVPLTSIRRSWEGKEDWTSAAAPLSSTWSKLLGDGGSAWPHSHYSWLPIARARFRKIPLYPLLWNLVHQLRNSQKDQPKLVMNRRAGPFSASVPRKGFLAVNTFGKSI